MKFLIPACVITFCGLAHPSSAQGPSADVLYVTGQADFIQSARGGGGGVTWLHTTPSQTGLDLGVSSASVADASWTYGRLGGFTRRRTAILSGALDVGGGRQGSARFDYQRYRGEIVVPVQSNRVLVGGEAQYLRLASEAQRVLRAGTVIQLSPRAAVRADYYSISSTGGTSAAVFGGTDLKVGRVGVLAGLLMAPGHRATSPLLEPGAVPQASREWMVGWRLPVGSYEVTWTVDVRQQAGVRTSRMLVGLRIPLSAQTSGRGL